MVRICTSQDKTSKGRFIVNRKTMKALLRRELLSSGEFSFPPADDQPIPIRDQQNDFTRSI